MQSEVMLYLYDAVDGLCDERIINAQQQWSAVSWVAFLRSFPFKWKNPFTTPIQCLVAWPLAKKGFSSILEFWCRFTLVPTPHFGAAIHWISAGSRNPVHRVQLIFHEQQLCCGGLLFLLSPLDDAVIEPSSSHFYGLAANMCNNGFIVRSCKIKRWLGFEVER